MKRKIVALLASLTCCWSLSAQMLTINGVPLEYEVKGDSGPVVFFDAGALSGMAGWDGIWDKLPKGIQAIRYSRRGEGHSGDCHGSLTASDYVNDVEQLLKQLHITKPFVYVSHSYGGKLAREYAKRHPKGVSAMLFVDPINPRDIDIIKQVDPMHGPAEIAKTRQDDLAFGRAQHLCLIRDIWDKSPALGFKQMGDIPITLIAGIKKHQHPKRIFDSDQARALWGQYQAQWVNQFPRGKAVMATHSGHFVQDEQPELVVKELNTLLKRADKV